MTREAKQKTYFYPLSSFFSIFFIYEKMRAAYFILLQGDSWDLLTCQDTLMRILDISEGKSFDSGYERVLKRHKSLEAI